MGRRSQSSPVRMGPARTHFATQFANSSSAKRRATRTTTPSLSGLPSRECPAANRSTSVRRSSSPETVPWNSSGTVGRPSSRATALVPCQASHAPSASSRTLWTSKYPGRAVYRRECLA